MATAQYRTLSKRIIDGLSVDDKDTVFWDYGLMLRKHIVPALGELLVAEATSCAPAFSRPDLF